MLDLKIVNANIVDGTGRPGYTGAVGVRGGRIVALGAVDEAALETIDARGKTVTPGFIDVHTHYDAQVCWDPSLSPSSVHGVTTAFGGNCGFSIAPLTPDAADYLIPMLARVEGMPIKALREGVSWDWSSFGSYLHRIEGRLAINAGFLAGHSTIRRVIMGERAQGEKATEAELDAMKALLARSIEEGALGFSSTVSLTHNDADGEPVPSRHASRKELMALAGVCGRYEGTLLELQPGTEFDQGVYDLLTDFSLAGSRPVNWNMLVVTGTSPTEVARPARQIEATDYARSRGAEVIALTLPCTATVRVNFLSGFLLDALAGWQPLFQLPVAKRIERLKDRAHRAALNSSARSEASGILRSFADWRNYTIVETFTPETRQYAGRNVGEIADEENKDPFDVILDISIQDELRTSLMPLTDAESREAYVLRARYWRDDRTVVGASDAGAHNDMIDTFAFTTKMLQKGVREHAVISLEDAVHQLTEVPARLMGLRDRGVIRVGWHADLVILDPGQIGCGPVHTRNDFPGGESRLYAEAEGISHVIVNGAIVVQDGRHTGALPGTVLRPGRDTYTVTPAAVRDVNSERYKP